MKIIAIADLHGQLPEIPPCDLLLVAGDVCPVWDHRLIYQQYWLDKQFNKWLSHCEARQIVMTWGNHDAIAQERPRAICPFHSQVKVLVDELFEWEGLRIYGLPWQLTFNDWAFNLDEPALSEKFRAIPDCEIIVSHGPPRGLGDRTVAGVETGCQEFTNKLYELPSLQLAVFGHIHEGRGRWEVTRENLTSVEVANVSYLDERYKIAQPPQEFFLTP